MNTFELYCGAASYPACLAAGSKEAEFGLNYRLDVLNCVKYVWGGVYRNL